MVKQLGIFTSSLTLSCADLRWEELPYIIIKLNNPGISNEKLKTLSYQEKNNILNNNLRLVARHFLCKVEVFFKEFILDMINIILFALNFKKGLATMSIHFYGLQCTKY